MDQMTTRKPTSESSAAKITRQAQMLSAQLQSLRTHMYPPEAMKSLRTFTSRDVATMTVCCLREK